MARGNTSRTLMWIFCAAATSPSWATDVTVTVKEKGTGVLVEGATVVLNQGATVASTDAAGEARLSGVSAPAQVKVLAAGYEALTRELTVNGKPFTVYLVPLRIEAQGLEVSAERVREQVSKVTLATEELVNLPGIQGDPLKAVTALPGIVAVEETSAEVYMRGSDAGDNVVWVNRAPVGYLYHLGGFQSTINPALIDDINVFLSGFPVEYGDALGGVLDVQLRAPRTDRMHYQLDISTITSALMAEGPVSKGSDDGFFVAARRSYIDLLFSPDDLNKMFEDDKEEDPDQLTLVPRFYDFQAVYRHALAQGHVDAYLFAAGDEQAVDIRGSAKSDPQLAGELKSSTDFQTAGMTWQQAWNPQLDHVMTLAYYHAESGLHLGQDEQGRPYYADTETSSVLLQPELHWRFRAAQELTAGFAANHFDVPVDLYISRPPDENDVDLDFTSQKKYRLSDTVYLSSLAPYLKHRVQWTERLITTVGLRYSDIRASGGFHAAEWSPRASAEYAVRPGTLLTASWGRYIQIPDGIQIIDTFGNPGLEVTEAEHRSIGIKQRLTPLYSVEAEIYHKPMRSLVVSIDENDPPDNYANQGTGEAYGIDVFVRREPRGRKRGWLSLSYGKSTRKNAITGERRDFSGDLPFALTAVWGQPFGGSWSKFDWSVRGEIHSGTPYTEVVGRHHEDPNDTTSRWIPEYGRHNGERTPTYYRLDLRVAREVLLDEWKMNFYIDMQNVTFAENVVEYDYGNEYERIGNPREVTGLPFFPYFGVEIKF
jgi:outer membrane receptor protein involved in Fe transport